MHAMIITAYRDGEGLLRVLRSLGNHCLCFVHADAKGEITEEQVARMNALPNVRAIRRYRVYWGSVRHLEALLLLMRMALSDGRVTHLHLISAQDFPTVYWRAFEAAFEGDARIHMQRLVTADYPELSHRYRHYHFMHLMNYRDMSERAQNWVGRIDRWQDALHISRKLELPYKGLVWCSMPRDAAEHAVFSPEGKRLLRKLRYTYIPEEFYFQNCFAEAPWRERVTGDALRFSVWDEPERGTPALLDTGDLPAIDASRCLFCRKVEAGSALYQVLEARYSDE